MKQCPKCGKTYPDYADTCPECVIDLDTGREFQDSDYIENIVAHEKAEKKYGSLIKRFFSIFIDSTIVGIVLSLISGRLLFTLISNLDRSDPGAARGLLVISIIYASMYALLMLACGTFFIGKYESTVGQKICKLKVLNADDGKLGYKGAFLRGSAFLIYSIPYISSILYIVSAILITKTPKKQAIHDKMFQTVVVNILN